MGTTITVSGISLVSLLAMVTAAEAQSGPVWGGQNQAINYSTPDETLRINAGIGAMYLRGDEKVMAGNYTVSHLIWESTVPVLRGSLALEMGNGLSIGAEGSVAGLGTSYMEDYDWLKGDDTFDNWSHRSQHPDTSLDHYWSGAVSLGYEIVRDQTAVIRAHGGLKYTDLQWTARSGSYIYSSNGGFRDQSGNFADGQPGITYRQQLPEFFLGVDGEERYGNMRVGGLLRGGVTFLSVATDDHWMRNLRFVDDLYVAPTFAVGGDVGFALGPNAEVTFAARYDHVIEQRGDTKYYNIATGNQTGSAADAAAGGLRSATLTAGLSGKF